MNALWQIILRAGLAVVSALPVERVAAILLDRLLRRLDAGNIDRARQTAAHLAELADLFADVLADRQVSEEEVITMRSAATRTRELLLERWADGQSARRLQADMADRGINASYAQPDEGGGHADGPA